MFRPLMMILLVLIAIVAACNNATDEPDAPAPTPTSLLASRFNGPLLNTSGNTDTADASDCSVGSDCGLQAASNVEAAPPLPLSPITWQGLSIGLPAGFEDLDFDDRLAIESTEDQLQREGFRVLIRWTDATSAEALVGRYVALDTERRTEHTNALGTGYTIPNADMGMVGVWTLADGRVLLVEGFVMPGYWPRYAATYNAIVDGLTLAER